MPACRRPALEVLLIGLGPTPMLYFAVHQLGADGGIQITGSHNPPDYNGFKMMLGTKPFYGDADQGAGPDRRVPATSPTAPASRRRSTFRGLYRAPRRRLSRHAALVGGVGLRQRPAGPPWRRWRPACPAATPACSPRSTATSPTTIPTHRAGEPGGPDPHRDRGRLRARHRPSTATATGSASSTARAASSTATRSCRSWRPTC